MNCRLSEGLDQTYFGCEHWIGETDDFKTMSINANTKNVFPWCTVTLNNNMN